MPKKFFDPKANLRALTRLVVIVAILLGGVWLFLRMTAGEKAANKVASSVLRQRINLVDSIEDLPASTFKTVSLSLPYTGTLTVEVAIKRGNDISVFLVTPDQLDKLKAQRNSQRIDFQHIQGFDAEKTKGYRRSGRVASGTYHLVLLDRTLGVLSQASSDVQVRARLEP